MDMKEANSTVLTADLSQLDIENQKSCEQLTINFDHITKTFGHVIANDSVNCNIQTGGIHAFLGENGAGKSTLMKILAGYYQPDAGAMSINGKPVTFKSPADARTMGIGMVHQQFTLVPSLTVLENIMLGHPTTPFFLQARKQATLIAQKAAQYGISIDLNTPISQLNMAQKQKVEILKLLWRDARILILDEPTSQLAPFEAEEILQTMNNLASSGKIVILITHHIEELLKFASVISVLRQGKLIATFAGQSVKAEELAQVMIGDDKIISSRAKEFHSDVTKLALKNVGIKTSINNRALKDINLEIKSGEVHGIAGVTGSGQDELAHVLAGHLIPEKGELLLEGELSSWKKLRSAHSGVAYIPSDPKKGSLAYLNLLENILLRGIHRKEFLLGPFIKNEHAAKMAQERIAAFDVRPKHVFALGGSLSGGNLQRLIIAREFDKPAPIMVAVNPTAGLDLAMSIKIRNEFRQYVSAGRSVLLISPDLDELLKTCDRISVMFAGRIVGTEYVNNLNSEKLGMMMGGNSLAANIDFSPELISYNSAVAGAEQASFK